MYKFLSIIMCVIIVCFALCACGRDETASDVASEAISDMESDSNGTVSDEDGMIGNENNNSNNNGNAQNSDNNQNNETQSDSFTDETTENSSESFM